MTPIALRYDSSWPSNCTKVSGENNRRRRVTYKRRGPLASAICTKDGEGTLINVEDRDN